MSVASLQDRTHVVEIADEIESFMNVILYNAMRYLPFEHELTRGRLIQLYFTDDPPAKDGSITCKSNKKMVITEGTLTFYGEELLFKDSTILNQLFVMMLELFKARYEVRAYEAAKKKEEETKHLRSTSSLLTTSPHPLRTPAPTKAYRTHLIPVRSGPSRFNFDTEDTKELQVQPPSEETKDKARKLDDHAETLDIFVDALYDVGRWSSQPSFDLDADISLPLPWYCLVASPMSSYRDSGSTDSASNPNEMASSSMESNQDQPQSKKLRVNAGTTE